MKLTRALAVFSIATTSATAIRIPWRQISGNMPWRRIWGNMTPIYTPSFSPSFSCYRFGETYSVEKATHHAEQFCRGELPNSNAGSDPSPHGRFKPGEVKGACVDTWGDVRYEMSLRYLPPEGTDAELRDEECVFQFWQLIKKCVQIGRSGGTGGYNRHENWEYQ